MAVTQQLARLTEAELHECRSRVEAIDQLCSFRLRPSCDYLDLDWSPRLFLAAAHLSEAPEAVTEALRLACEGVDEINPSYREAADTVWEHPVACLRADQVRGVASALARLSPERLITSLAIEPREAVRQLGLTEGLSEPCAYVYEHFVLLREFYDGAATGGLATAMWWD